jgi:hypothetical protein
MAATLLIGCGSTKTSTAAKPADNKTAASSAKSGGRSVEKYCEVAKRLDAADAKTSGSSDPTAELKTMSASLKEITAVAPDEISADIKALTSTLEPTLALFSKYDYDIAKLSEAAAKDPKIMEQLTAIQDADAKMTDITKRLEIFDEKNCGIKPKL